MSLLPRIHRPCYGHREMRALPRLEGSPMKVQSSFMALARSQAALKMRTSCRSTSSRGVQPDN
eukprot:2830094-Amphidinium_carterae.1